MKVIFSWSLLAQGVAAKMLSSAFTLFTFSSQIFRYISTYLAHHSALHKAAVCAKSLTQVLQKKPQLWFYCICLYNMYCAMQKLPEAEGISEPAA